MDKKKDTVYSESEPSIQMNSLIKSFWSFENNANRALEYSILPDGCFDFLVYNNSNTQLTGFWNKRIDISIPALTKIFAIRFKPLAVEYLLGSSLKDLLNSSIQNPKYVFLDKIDTKTKTFSEFVQVNSINIESVLKEVEIDSRKEKVFDLLFKTNGKITVKEISEKSYWSSRQLNRYFTSNFGLSTKQYANILRVNSTYKDIAKGTLFPQTEYFDQSHFIKEIKKYTGNTPKELSRNENDRFLQLSTKQIT